MNCLLSSTEKTGSFVSAAEIVRTSGPALFLRKRSSTTRAIPPFKVLPKFAWMAGKIFGLARATCFTNGEIGTQSAEFSEPDEENIFWLNSAIRIPN